MASYAESPECKYVMETSINESRQTTPQKKKGAIEMDGRVRFYYLSSLLPSLAAHHTPNITHTKRIDLNTYIHTNTHVQMHTDTRPLCHSLFTSSN